MVAVALATEDALSEAVGCRLIRDFSGGLEVAHTLRKRGSGYLRSSLRKFCELARQMPVVLITDLDTHKCPATLIEDWAKNEFLPGQLTFRVAVRQIESWLLGDVEGIGRLLKVSKAKISKNPDSLSNAKHYLLRLAQHAPRSIRNELLAKTGAVASQGLGYNEILGEFVRTNWDPTSAATRSDSLSRAQRRLAELARQASNRFIGSTRG
jgi:hypothetical protein